VCYSCSNTILLTSQYATTNKLHRIIYHTVSYQFALHHIPHYTSHLFTSDHITSHHITGGMKRRLALALAFAGTPKVLLLDEPSSGCDSWTRELVRKDIMLKKESAAVLVSTHHIDDVEVLSDRVWFLNERYLAFNGPLNTLTELGSSSSFNTPTPSHDDVTRIAHTVLPVSLPRTLSPTATLHHKTTTQDMHTTSTPQAQVLSNTSPPTHPLSQYPHPSEVLLDASPTAPQDNSMLVELQFFTWSESVMRKFREEFSPVTADAWLMDR
jgi:energy-coupling factor transporter ATP-binding protein EcfA2